jgi:hypothetical protein
MHFAVDVDDRRDVLTSSVTAIERPPREVVAEYEELGKSGERLR